MIYEASGHLAITGHWRGVGRIPQEGLEAGEEERNGWEVSVVVVRGRGSRSMAPSR